MQAEAIPFVLIVGFMFGSSLLVSRFSLSQFDATTYVSARIFLSSLLFLLIFIFSSKHKIPKNKKLLKYGAFLGVVGTAVPMSFINISLNYQSSGITAILLTMGPAITVLLASIFLNEEPLTKRKGLGIVLSLSGALLLIALGENGLPDVSEANPLGYLLVLVAMIGGSTAVVFTRKYMRGEDAIDITGVRMLVAALVVVPLSYMFVKFDFSRVTSMGLVALGWATIGGTFLGMLFSFYNAKRFGATASAMSTYVVTIVASLGGVIFLGESFTIGMFAGMLLIIGGVSLIYERKRSMQSQ